MNFTYTELGQRIAKRRKQLNLRQNALAEILGISNNHMSCIETGKTPPSLQLMYEICNALKVTPDYLMMGTMRSSNVPQALINTISLCTEEDIEMLCHMAKYMAERNCKSWNDKNFV